MVSLSSPISELVNGVISTPSGIIITTHSGAGRIIAELIDQAGAGYTIAGDNTILAINITENAIQSTVSGLTQPISSLVESVNSTPSGIVVTTSVSGAGIIAELIDQANIGNTIAGDDTILVIGSSENAINNLLNG
ncbi:MAG: hypothetical protein LBC92_05270 [Rickettsiales bacterium]|jgi:arginine repressor|nr:hypothetical protein [Rickettsiales bacterium]